MAVGTYSLGDAARILRVSPERLRSWERKALVRLRDGVDSPPALDFRQLVSIKALLGLLERGVPLRHIRLCVEALRRRDPEIEDPLSTLRLWEEGSGRVVVDHDGLLLEPDGQLLLDLRPSGGPGGAVSALEPHTAPRDPAAPGPSALEYFERGCALDSDPATYDAAVEAYRRAIQLEPGFADAHCNLGAVLYHQGQRAAARRCFERCLERSPTHLEAHFNLGSVLEEDGAIEAARFHYRAVLEIDPGYADAHVHLALLCESLGLPDDAASHWRHYLQCAPQGAWATVARQRLREGP